MPSTTRYRRGDIVLVSFLFTDLSSSKRRPALVVSPDTFNERRQDLVLAAITSQLTDDRLLTIERDDCVDGSLPQTSVVQPTKLFTIHATLVLKTICAPAGREAPSRPRRDPPLLRVVCQRRRARDQPVC